MSQREAASLAKSPVRGRSPASNPASSEARAYAAQGPMSPLGPFNFSRRAPGERDVRIEIAYCGVCHSDIHMARNEWGNSTYPLVPGHEIVGRISSVGCKVKKLKVGDVAGVGCMVDSCRRCPNCREGLEQHCLSHTSFTYGNTE